MLYARVMAGPGNKKLVGVPTTTPIAFQSAGLLYLERMNILAEDGCGILCDTVPLPGEVLPVVFRLSTQKVAIRCRVSVEGSIPTTPGGLKLAQSLGEKGLHAATSSSIGDSATMMFRLDDIKPEPKLRPRTPGDGAPVHKAPGFCARFVDLGKDGCEAVARHLRISQRLADQLSTHAGGGAVTVTDKDRSALTQMFAEEGLSERAKDW